ncbi:MAG: potassium/proton antiporter [Thermoanaerobaculia bacterium]
MPSVPPHHLLAEPEATAWLLVVTGVLLGLSVLFSRAPARLGVPVFLIFLAIGMLAGSEGIGGIAFEDYGFAFRLGTIALALILFDGGLNTPSASLRKGIGPASVLATAGVAGTAIVVAGGAHALGFAWGQALLLGAVVSSTDAAAVFSVLRGSGLRLKDRVGTTLELESGFNDPMAMILTVAVAGALTGGGPLGWHVLLEVVLQLAIGAAMGVGAGLLGRFLLRRGRVPAAGLYPVLTLALVLIAFGLPTLMAGSGFLAVYLAGMVLGGGDVPYRAGLRHFHDAAAWCAQVAMFLMLGLLIFPSHLKAVAWEGLGIALLLSFVARPLAVALCLLPFRFSWRETLFVGTVGLRGAVPIILATYPVLRRVEGGERLFDLVFFVVVVSSLIPGSMVARLAGWLGLAADSPPSADAVVEINSVRPVSGEVLSFYVSAALPVAGAAIGEIPFPAGAAVMLVVRGRELVPPRGGTVLEPGDHVHLFCRPEDRPFVELLFGRSEEG